MCLNPDWFLVGLTTVYVVATILICWANWASASAAKSQTAELIKQQEENVRARISIRYDKRSPVERALVLKNVGLRAATDVKLTVEPSFLDDLNTIWPQNVLKIATESRFVIAPKQEFWVLVGMSSALNQMKSQAMNVVVEYCDVDRKQYREPVTIDFSQYGFLTEVKGRAVYAENGVWTS